MAVLCLSGWKGSGKDSCADYLIRKYGAVRVALADPLKDNVAEEFQIDRTSLDDPSKKESPLLKFPVQAKDGFSKNVTGFMIREFRTASGFPPDPAHTRIENGNFEAFLNNWEQLYWTPRALAILKGSTNRSVTSDYWVQKTFQKIEALPKSTMSVVTDLRYQSELKQFDNHFKGSAVFIRINRFKDSPSSDPSERDLDNAEFDYYIDNTKTLLDLYGQLNDIIEEMLFPSY